MIIYNDLELPSQPTTIKDILRGSDAFYSDSFTQGPTIYKDYFYNGGDDSNHVKITASKVYLPNVENLSRIKIPNIELGYFKRPLDENKKIKIIIANNFSSISSSFFNNFYFLQYNVGRLYSTNSENIAAANAALSSNYQIFPTIELLPETRNDNEIPLDTLYNYTWEQILNADPEAAQSIIHIGDTKKLTFTDSNNNEQTLYMQIVGFGVDELEDGTKAKISWLSIPSIGEERLNSYSNSFEYPIRKYEYYNTIFENNGFNNALTTHIKPVKKYSYNFNTHQKTSSQPDILRFWLPSLTEWHNFHDNYEEFPYPIYNSSTLGFFTFWTRDCALYSNKLYYAETSGVSAVSEGYIENHSIRIGFCTN